MKCVVLQPSYLPWRGYFHQIKKADSFIFFDDVQYDKRSWRNRNRIKTANGTAWLTIPVFSKGHQIAKTPLNEIRINNEENWKKKHLLGIKYAYAKSPFFESYYPLIEDFFNIRDDSLADFTIDTTVKLSELLGINNTKFLRSSDYQVKGQKTDRLINLLKMVKATHYISGPAAKDYIERKKFEEANISLEFIKYDYPNYPQLYPPFDTQVSVLDLLFMTGDQAAKYIWKN